MMQSALIIQVRFHDGRYHGDGDWPPCPARLFQALVAGAGLSGELPRVRDALLWLERLPPPLIGAPLAQRGQRVMYYMPNNDMDAVGGDPSRIARIRTAKKLFSPWLFDAEIPFIYVWFDLPEQSAHLADAIRAVADRLYQLGRGVDMAWAWAEVCPVTQVDELLARYPGHIYHPSRAGSGNNGNMLLCPGPGSLQSICQRYAAFSHRFNVEPQGNTVKFTFHRAPPASFLAVSYGRPPSRYVYELRTPSAESSFAPWLLSEVSKLVVRLRDGAVERLKAALPDRHGEIERVLVGRKPTGANAGPAAERVRIIPLASIGHRHADRMIRRVLIEVPADCPLQAPDIEWAFSGLEPADIAQGEVYRVVLTPAVDDRILWHYAIGRAAKVRTWRTVTPAALPEKAARRRIEPTRKLAEAKSGVERLHEQRCAAAAVVQALRHAGVREQVVEIQVQREPFDSQGERVEVFAPGTRFSHHRLWHVKITFADSVSGPLVIGDGRFLGLGVMAPVAVDGRDEPLAVSGLPTKGHES